MKREQPFPLAFAMAALVALGGLGCIPRLRAAKVTDSPGPDEVLLLGRAHFDPPLYGGSKGPVYDPGGNMDQMVLGFTFSEDKAVDPEGVQGVDVYAAAVPGEPFAVIAPKRPLHLRRVYMAPEAARTGYKEITLYYVNCVTQKKLDVKPDDEVLYLGLVVCHRESAPVEVTVTDEWSSVKRVLGEYAEKRKLRTALLEGAR